MALAGLAWHASVDDREHRARAVARSAQATSREVELHLDGLRRALRVFAAEQAELLRGAVVPALGRLAAAPLAAKVTLHFPEHLAFAVSDPAAASPLASEPALFGAHCRAGLEAHARRDGSVDTRPALHRAGPGGVGHFDVLADIPGASPGSPPAGVIFVSFPVDDLQRLLRLGSSESGALVLRDAGAGDGRGGGPVLLSGGAYEEGADAASGLGSSDGSEVEVAVAGTPWTIAGRIDPEASAETRRALALQALLGLGALASAGAVARRAVERERDGRDRTSVLLAGVEAERRRIATELHDQVLADVSHVHRLLLDVEAEVGAALPDGPGMDDLREARRSVRAFSGAVRTVIDDLHPHALGNLGLCGAIEAHVRSRTGRGVAFDLELDAGADASLDAGRSLHVFRVAVEAVENVLRHARASRARVRLGRESGSVRLRVEDDGIGFDAGARGRGRGASNVEMRASALRARARWSSAPGRGTRFELVVPVPEARR